MGRGGAAGRPEVELKGGRLTNHRAVIAGAAAALLTLAHAAPAAEIKVLSGNGARAAVQELTRQFERQSGHKVALRFEVKCRAAAQDRGRRNLRCGRYFVSLVERLGISAEMKDRLKPMEAEDTVEVVARGEADMVVVVSSRIYDVHGIDPVGPIPAELQTMIGFAVGVGTAATEPAAALALVGFLSAPAAAPRCAPGASSRRSGTESAVALGSQS